KLPLSLSRIQPTIIAVPPIHYALQGIHVRRLSAPSKYDMKETTEKAALAGAAGGFLTRTWDAVRAGSSVSDALNEGIRGAIHRSSQAGAAGAIYSAATLNNSFLKEHIKNAAKRGAKLG